MTRRRAYGLAIVVGVGLGLVGAWMAVNRGLSGGQIVNGPWSTSLNLGTTNTDALTRAAVARAGLLALPASETLYWSATTDSDGAALDGKCDYLLGGPTLDARWWSVTIYDAKGYLMPNPAALWSVNGAAVPVDRAGRWQVAIAPQRPVGGGSWLPSDADQPFHLTLRMYNPGAAFMAAPQRAALPQIRRTRCA